MERIHKKCTYSFLTPRWNSKIFLFIVLFYFVRKSGTSIVLPYRMFLAAFDDGRSLGINAWYSIGAICVESKRKNVWAGTYPNKGQSKPDPTHKFKK